MAAAIKKLGLVAFASLFFLSYFYFDLSSYFTLENIKAQQDKLQHYYLANQALALSLFFIGYTLATALSIPIATPLTLASGAVFGFIPALILCSFASTFGASLAFLASRFLFHDWIQNKYKIQLQTLNKGIKAEGVYYLFFLRLTPVFPFFLVNLLVGLTKIKFTPYYLASQIGMLPGTALFVFAGTELSKIQDPADILSLNLISVFTLIGLMPIAIKKLKSSVQKK